MSYDSQTDAIVMLVTAPDEKIAAALARDLVEQRLAACVNLISAVRSIYRWKAEICDEGETLMVVKTSAHRASAVEQRISEKHPYETPEVIALEITGGQTDYLAWLDECVDH
jgi:periplasmic divalent cation tolerance protein